MGTVASVVVLPVGSQSLIIEETEFPEPGPDQVEIRQFASGICHSQLHQINGKRKQDLLLGHESTGMVSKIGENVSHLQPGDTVFVTWVPRNAASENNPPKGACLQLKNGPAYSRDVFTWADHVLVDQQYVVKVSPDISRDVTAIIACAVMTGAGAVINTAGVQAGQSVAVFGVGGVGLSTVAAARVVGAGPIIAVDLDEKKLELARQFGATHTINAVNEEPVEVIHRLTSRDDAFIFNGKAVSGVDYSFDCIGLPETMKQILMACRKGQFGVMPGGTAVLVGIPVTSLEVNVYDMVLAEKCFKGSIGGSCTPDRDFPLFLDWHKQGLLDLESLVTTRFGLDEINEAVLALQGGEILGRAIIEF